MDEGKSKSSRLGKVFGAAALLSGALALIPTGRDAVAFVYGQLVGLGTVDLPNAYPNEVWREALRSDYEWLAGEWCYMGLEGFKSTYDLTIDGIKVQNQPSYPAPDVSEWKTAQVYQSDSGLLKVVYEDRNWQPSYIRRGNYGTLSSYIRWREDNGDIASSTENMAFECEQCTFQGFDFQCSFE